MPEARPPIELHGVSLDELQKVIDEQRLPPVEQWDPPHCGHSGMRIARDGTWYHQGSPIRRAAMVCLFSTILRREPDGRHVLVTPVEKLDIDVESTPLQAVEMRSDGEAQRRRIVVKLNNGEALVISPEHPLVMRAGEHGPSPRILVRHGLEAELARPLYYELAEIALAEGQDPPGIWSSGQFFALDEPA